MNQKTPLSILRFHLNFSQNLTRLPAFIDPLNDPIEAGGLQALLQDTVLILGEGGGGKERGEANQSVSNKIKLGQ